MGIIDDAKDIAKLIKKYNDADLYQKIVDLRDEIFKLREENLRLKEKNKTLEEEKSINEKILWESPYYWIKDRDKKDGPFCQKCFDENKKLIRLQNYKYGRWHCLVCKSDINDSSYKIPKPYDYKSGCDNI
jgi:hypothetical protein